MGSLSNSTVPEARGSGGNCCTATFVTTHMTFSITIIMLPIYLLQKCFPFRVKLGLTNGYSYYSNINFLFQRVPKHESVLVMLFILTFIELFPSLFRVIPRTFLVQVVCSLYVCFVFTR